MNARWSRANLLRIRSIGIAERSHCYGFSSWEGAVRGGTDAKSAGAEKKKLRIPSGAFHRAIERRYLPSCSRTHRRPRRLRGPYAGTLRLRSPASRGVRRRRCRAPRAQPTQPPPRCSPCSFQESTRSRTPGSAPGRQPTVTRRCVASQKSNGRFLPLPVWVFPAGTEVRVLAKGN